MYTATLTVIFIVFSYILLVWRYTYWSRKSVPQYKFWKIWFLNIMEVIRQQPLTDLITKLYNDFRDERYVGTYQLFMPRLCIKDPELIKMILVKDFDHFVDHTMFIPTDGDPIWEQSLFSLTGDRWRHMRALSSPSFTSSKMKIMFGTMLTCSKTFLAHMEKYNDNMIRLEMKEIFARLTSDVFFATHFGIMCNSLEDPNNTFYLMGKKGADFGGFWIKLRFVLIQLCPTWTKMFGLKVFDQSVSKFFKRLVKENIDARRAQKIVLPDLIQLLMENANEATMKEDGDALTLDQITSFALAFFGGGFDSVSTLLSFVAYELALHSDVQKTLQEEVDRTWEDCKGSITYDILLRMEYIDMVISETLRKWPGGFFLDRRCVKPYTIQPERSGELPIHLKRGDGVWLPLFALQRDSQCYPEPDLFIPERFSAANKANLSTYMYMPFGTGPRHCIGNRFALLEAKVMIFQIMRKFSFCVIEKTAIPIRLARRNFQLTSKDGFWLGLQRRKC